MLKKRIFILVSVLAILTMALSPVYAGGGCKKCYGKKSKLEKKIYKNAKFLFNHKQMLNLKDDQLAKIKDLKMDMKKSLIQNKADIDIIKVDIKSKLYYSDKVDQRAVEKLIDQKYKSKKEMAKTLVRTYVGIMDVLTPEQKDVLKSVESSGCKKDCCRKKKGYCPKGKMKCPGMKYHGKASN